MTTNNPSNDPIVNVSGLKKHYQQSNSFLDRILGGSGNVHALDGVDLEIFPGETLAVVGESGCGKTTLGQTILQLEEPTEGSVFYKHTDLTDISDRTLREYRSKMQMIFQDPQGSLNPRKTVKDILEVPLRVHNIGENKEERRNMIQDMLERVGLNRRHISRYPQQFSGGQQQRLGIARSLIMDPEFIVADEPTSALDVSVQTKILDLLSEFQEEMKLTILFITHDLSVVRYIADRVAVMYLGEVVEIGPTEEIFTNPAHPYTQSLLSSIPHIDPSARRDQILLEGSVPSSVNPPSGCRFHTRCPKVIPPNDWKGGQDLFRNVFNLRTQMINGDIDPKMIKSRLASEGKSTTSKAIGSALVERELGDDLDSLSSERIDGIHEAVTALVHGDEKEAIEIIDGVLPSPCMETHPSESEVSKNGHVAKCLRIDESTTTQRQSGE